jgi:hypothetical protein
MSQNKNKRFNNDEKQLGFKNKHPSLGFKSSRMSSISRAEKSLTSLTTKFMSLLQESPNGVLDLRNVPLEKAT